MSLELNDLETARFGVVCARLIGDDIPLADVNATAVAANVQMITARVDVGALDRIHALEADGYRLMDTLVYYARPLEDLPAAPVLAKDVSMRLAVPADAPRVAEVARDAFQGYFGHYHADPRLDNAAADAAYVEWAETATAQCGSKEPVLIVENKTAGVVGFATMRLNSKDESEGVLFGIHPNAQGGGLYSAFIIEAMHEGQNLGTSRMIVSTQINNYAVQRVWARLGFTHCRSLYTFHKWVTA
jgi:RimJ/RimL family protein N-acetyltransferase